MNAATGPARAPYLARPGPRALVFGSFVLVALPLAVYLVVAMRVGLKPSSLPIAQAYFVLFGITHFFLTFTVYMSSSNRRHFLASRRNVLVFLVAPLAALVGLAGFYGFGLGVRFLLANVIVFTTIRGLDFYHVSRQSFGVLQLFKGSSARAIPAWTRTAENHFFLSLAVLMFLTFMSDLRFDARSPLVWAVMIVSAGLLLVVLYGYARGLRAGADRKQTAVALAYLAIQTGSSLLAVYRTELYIASLAVHYVEYHVIMAPRVFRSPTTDADRALAIVRRFPLALYGVLGLAAASWWLLFRAQGAFAAGPVSARVLVHVFDGIFVFHYIIEMSIWKFSDPYFRKTLGPLYG
jgi:hypothetical protein